MAKAYINPHSRVEDSIMWVGAVILALVIAIGGLTPVSWTHGNPWRGSPKQEAKEAGHDTKEAAKDTGRATKDAAKKTGRGVKKGTSKAAGKTEEGARKVKDKTDPH